MHDFFITLTLMSLSSNHQTTLSLTIDGFGLIHRSITIRDKSPTHKKKDMNIYNSFPTHSLYLMS